MSTKIAAFPVRNLAELEEVAISFRMLWNAVPGGFSRAQLAGWGWLKEAFYAPSIKHEYRELSEKRKKLVDELFIDVETILEDEENCDNSNPDSVKPKRRKKRKSKFAIGQERFVFPED